MQVKPRFESYKIVEQYPFLIDDTGNEICLTLMEVWLKSDETEIMETPYRFWCCIGKRQERWNNKAVSYLDIAFWKDEKRKKLFKDTIHEFLIEEIEDGEHFVFSNEKPGLRTCFKLTRNKN